MNTNYIYEYSHLLERLFSVAYKIGYSFKALEKEIADSPFFQKVEKDYNYVPIINDYTLIKEIFHDEIKLEDIPVYNQCLWAAESYLRIQSETKLTLEAIFLYIPIVKMFDYFPIFHEMDFSQIIDEFNRLYNSRSVLDLLMSRYKYSVGYVSNSIGLPYDTLYSYKQRRRDIKKINAEIAYRLSALFRVRIETLLEIKN